MMELMWYVVGILAGLAGYLVYKLSRKYTLGIVGLGGLATGLFLLLFTIAWVVGSVLEGVPRAASMGLVFFAMPGIVILTFIVKRFLKPLYRKS
jgi:multisubunit Na+/H+ antiporter MnhC subunit